MENLNKEFLELLKKYDCSIVNGKAINKYGKYIRVEKTYSNFEESFKILKEETFSIIEEQLQITYEVK